jgi:hypothetical protein
MVLGSVLSNTESAQHLYLYITQQQQQHMDDSPLTVLIFRNGGGCAGSSQCSKTREPDVFHGTDTSKLQPFLMQCNLTFSDLPDKYSTDRSKVICTLSFLCGTAMNWFLPGLNGLSVKEPTWFNDWPSFVTELTTNFGPHDIVGDAEASLNNVKMKKDTQWITKYIVQFNSLAALVSWGGAALQHHFYTGFPA